MPLSDPLLRMFSPLFLDRAAAFPKIAHRSGPSESRFLHDASLLIVTANSRQDAISNPRSIILLSEALVDSARTFPFPRRAAAVSGKSNQKQISRKRVLPDDRGCDEQGSDLAMGFQAGNRVTWLSGFLCIASTRMPEPSSLFEAVRLR